MEAEPKVHILLVDDHPENLLALEAILSDLGQPLVKSQSGREALRHLLDTDFAVILLDVQMPEMDGFETARLIRQREKSRYIPIIFLTAIDKSDERMFRGYAVGAVDYLLKPFVPEVLRAKVAVFVELFKKTVEVRRQAEQLAVANRTDANVLLYGESGVGKEVVARYIHAASRRRHRDFVAINCASLSDEIL